MKITTRIAAVVLGAGLLATPAVTLAQGPPPGYGQRPGPGPGSGGWDAPPRDFTRDIQRTGFRDGMYGAQKDFDNRRRPDVNNRDEYRNYRGPERRFYRDAFARGYRTWWDHSRGGPGPGRRPY